jgi:hypothetical protein
MPPMPAMPVIHRLAFYFSRGGGGDEDLYIQSKSRYITFVLRFYYRPFLGKFEEIRYKVIND